ncbi:MAG: hypothetical protein CMO43_02515, partial [Verrucomicrobiales bacterium]|nr:hypothetical protein [Verrucomicrobiales bacterium]
FVMFTLGYIWLTCKLFPEFFQLTVKKIAVKPVLVKRILILLFMFFYLLLLCTNKIVPFSTLFSTGKMQFTLSLHVHPTQVYAALLNVALYGGLAWLYRRKRFDGQVFGAYLVGYSICRFVVEFFRGDYAAGELWLGWIKPGQQLSLLLLPVGVALLVFLRRRARG